MIELETKSKMVNFENINQDVLVIVLLYKNENFIGNLKPYDIDMYGKKMWEWVSLAGDDYIVKTTTCCENSNILSLIKPLLIDSKYTLVLYSDTPLLQKTTIEQILDYVETKNFNVLKLPRGYVFNTEYIKTVDSFSGTQSQTFSEEDFFVVDNYKKLCYAKDILKNRILDYHLNNGVQIDDLNSVFIDADVIIENGTKIGANNVIKGISIVQKNCDIGFGNYIDNSIISSGAKITQSNIIESRISENMVVGPFENIKNRSV